MSSVTHSIEQPVRQARRRLLIARFFESLWRLLFAGWMLAALAILAAAIWPLPGRHLAAAGDPQTAPVGLSPWGIGWMAATTALAVILAAVWTMLKAPSLPQVAADVDARFGLRERLSSALQMPNSDLQTPMGQALLADAQRQAQPLDVRDQFSLRPHRYGWLPLLPATLMLAALFIPPRHGSPDAVALSPQLVSQAQQVKTAAEALKKRLQQQSQRSEEAGLEEAEQFFKKLEREVDHLISKPNIGPKEAMIELNDIKKQLDDRRQQLGGNDQMKSALAKLTPTEQGSADEFAKAMQAGDVAKAKQMAQEIAKKLRSGELSEQEKAALQQQMEQISEKLKAAAEKHQAATEQLQKQIDEAKQAGRHDEAAKLEQRMQEMQAQAAQAQQMQQMAEKMDAAAKAMKSGDKPGDKPGSESGDQSGDGAGSQSGGKSPGSAGAAADALDSISDQLSEMENEMQELQDLDDAMDALAESKSQMNCGSCQGQGCASCKGNGSGQNGGDGASTQPSSQYGTGNGPGDGDPKDLQASTYDTQVRGQQRAGESRVTGYADGPNRKGASRAEIREAVQDAIADQSDPLENQNLPRAERDHARSYFDQLRSGSKTP